MAALHALPHRHQFLSRPIHSSTSWRAPDEKPARHPENLFLLAQRHATYFPRQRSTSLPHYFFPPRTLWFNLASRLVAVWTPAAWHSCCGIYQISQAHQCNTHRHTQTHSTCSCQRPFQAESGNICLETSGLACSAWGHIAENIYATFLEKVLTQKGGNMEGVIGRTENCSKPYFHPRRYGNTFQEKKKQSHSLFSSVKTYTTAHTGYTNKS